MKITCTLSSKSLLDAARQVEQYRKGLEHKKKLFLERLAAIGVETARVGFANAQYDGSNDVTVKDAVWESENRLVITAEGRSLLFIEFGAGVHYAAPVHQNAAEFGYTRGGYGHHLGLRDSWRYTGDPGTNGKLIAEGKHKGDVLTHGNPANRCMYEAGKRMREEIIRVAREVFADD